MPRFQNLDRINYGPDKGNYRHRSHWLDAYFLATKEPFGGYKLTQYDDAGETVVKTFLFPTLSEADRYITQQENVPRNAARAKADQERAAAAAAAKMKAEHDKAVRLSRNSHRDHHAHLWMTIDRDTAIQLIADLSRNVAENREIRLNVATARGYYDKDYTWIEDESRAVIDVNYREYNVPVIDSLIEPRQAAAGLSDADEIGVAV